MTPADLEGATFGPAAVPVTAERVADFVAASGDDPARWARHAPPGFAAVLLFAVAGDFLWDERIAAHTRTLLHLDQAFAYEAPLDIGSVVTVTGGVGRTRSRAGAHFVTFRAEGVVGGATVVRSSSSFLMSAEPTGEPGVDTGEPPPTLRGVDERPSSRRPALGPLPDLAKSASRADLIRYAAVTKDFNPIHWDHDAARSGGAPGVIVHGLLLLSWSLQQAASIGRDADPVAAAKLRFRAPLRPAEQGTVAASVEELSGGEAVVALRVGRGTDEVAVGSATVRIPPE